MLWILQSNSVEGKYGIEKPPAVIEVIFVPAFSHISQLPHINNTFEVEQKLAEYYTSTYYHRQNGHISLS